MTIEPATQLEVDLAYQTKICTVNEALLEVPERNILALCYQICVIVLISLNNVYLVLNQEKDYF